MSEEASVGAAADAGDTEISREAALERLLTDESLADVTLKGTDGVEVPVNKGLLAARSEVFRALLYGNFAEGSESIVSIGYKGSVLKAVVEYIYTNRLAHSVAAGSAEDARTAAAIIDAASYFHLPGLHEKAKEITMKGIYSDPSMAFEYLSAGTELNVMDMEQSAMTCLRKKLPEIMETALVGESIQTLAPSVVERILRDEEIEADEKTLFLLLKMWSGSGEDVGGKNRKEIACDMAAHIRLEQIDPSTLSELVAPSGLVTDVRLMELFKAQAILLASAPSSDIFNRKRKHEPAPCWKPSAFVGQSQSILKLSGEEEPSGMYFAFIDVPELTSGLHKWSVKATSIVSETGSIFVGVVCPEMVPETNGPTYSVDIGRGSWLYRNDGCGCHGLNATQRSVPFADGSVLNLVLDLRQDSSGTLSISVDTTPMKLIFSNINVKRSGKGILPAIWFRGPVEIEVLDMKSE